MKIKQILFAAAMVLFVVACEPKPEEPQQPNEPQTPEEPTVLVSVNPLSLAFGAEGGTQSVTLTAEGVWSVECEGEWLSIGAYDDSASKQKSIPIEAAANATSEPREGRVIFSVGDQSAEVVVTQEAGEVEEESKELSFYVNPEGGYSGSSHKPKNLLSEGYGPGHQLTLLAGADMAVLTLLDYDFAAAGCSSYAYLTAHLYPLVEGDKQNAPSVSCLVVNPELSYFIIGGERYYPVVPESATDENGRAYGFLLLWTNMPNSDINVCEFCVPVEDAEGNRSVVNGGFSGKLAYEMKIPATRFDLPIFGFTKFKAAEGENGAVTLTSTSINGEFVFALTTTDGSYASAEGESFSFDDKTLSGYFVDSETFAKYTFTSGAITIKTNPTEKGTHTLIVESAVGFAAPGLTNTYEIVVGEYPITIE